MRQAKKYDVYRPDRQQEELYCIVSNYLHQINQLIEDKPYFADVILKRHTICRAVYRYETKPKSEHVSHYTLSIPVAYFSARGNFCIIDLSKLDQQLLQNSINDFYFNCDCSYARLVNNIFENVTTSNKAAIILKDVQELANDANKQIINNNIAILTNCLNSVVETAIINEINKI